MNDRADLTLDNQTYAKIGKNKWEHIPNNPHAWGSTYTDKEVYELVKKAKSVKLTESVGSKEVAPIEESYSADDSYMALFGYTIYKEGSKFLVTDGEGDTVYTAKSSLEAKKWAKDHKTSTKWKADGKWA